jgi:hypothetical protein
MVESRELEIAAVEHGLNLACRLSEILRIFAANSVNR